MGLPEEARCPLAPVGAAAVVAGAAAAADAAGAAVAAVLAGHCFGCRGSCVFCGCSSSPPESASDHDCPGAMTGHAERRRMGRPPMLSSLRGLGLADSTYFVPGCHSNSSSTPMSPSRPRGLGLPWSLAFHSRMRMFLTALPPPRHRIHSEGSSSARTLML